MRVCPSERRRLGAAGSAWRPGRCPRVGKGASVGLLARVGHSLLGRPAGCAGWAKALAGQAGPRPRASGWAEGEEPGQARLLRQLGQGKGDGGLGSIKGQGFFLLLFQGI